MASTIFGSFNNEQQVTVNSNQQVRGRKTFLNAGNEYAGTFVDPTFTVNGVSITSTEVSYLEGLTSNIQDQLDDKLDLSGGTLVGELDIEDNNAEILTYLPTQFVTANSNTPTPIPASNLGKYQVVLTSSYVPLEDELEQSTNIDAGETVLCSAFTQVNQYIGTDQGNLYVFDLITSNWLKVNTFDGAIYTLFWDVNLLVLLIGGEFVNMSYPTVQSNYNRICYITDSTSPQTPLYWIFSTTLGVGFDNAVCSITSDGMPAGYLYFAGKFDATYYSSIQLKKMACYDNSTQTIYPLNNLPSNGFDNTVWNMLYVQGYITVTGEFASVFSNGTQYDSSYAMQFPIAGWLQGPNPPLVFSGVNYNLSVPISSPSLITTNGATIYIGTNDVYNGINYVFSFTFSTIGVVNSMGTNQFSGPVTAMAPDNGSGWEVMCGSEYFQNGTFEFDIGFNASLFINSVFVGSTFGDATTGDFWNFGLSPNNSFTLQASRMILNNGASYQGGVEMNGEPGRICILLWDGTDYFVLSNTGGATLIN